MANNLDFSATLEFIDKVSEPLRTLEGQLERASEGYSKTRNALRDLQRQQNDISSFNKLTSELKDTSNKLDNARQNFSDLQRQMQATNAPTQALINNFNKAQATVGKLEHKFDSQNNKLRQVQSRLKGAGISTNDLANHQKRLAKEIIQANSAMTKQGNKLDKMRKIQAQSQKMEQMRNSSAMLMAKGMAGTYAGAKFIQPGLDLEKEMSKVQALTRLDANSEQFKALQQQAMHLGSTTAFTSADAGRGQAFLAMVGFTPEAIQKAMPSVLDLALAGGMELPQVADISSNIMSGMGLEDMSRVGDVLSASFTRANIDIAMLGETMKYAAPGAKGLNVSIEELASMAGKLGDAGIQGSEGGTALRSIMARLASTPKPVAKALAKLGIESKDAQGNLRPLPQLLKEIDDATKNMGTAERNEVLTHIAGMEASNALQILTEKAGSGELQKLTETLKNSDGELQQLSKTMNNNTLGDFKSLQSAMDGLRTSIFESNKDNIRDFIQAVTELTQKFTTFANEHPKLMSALGALFALLAVGAVIIGGIGAVMLTVLAPMAMLRASLVTLGLPTTLTPLSMLAKAFGFVGTAIRAVTAFMIANPIVAILIAIAAAAIYIWANWETLGPKFQMFYQCMIDVVSGWIEWTVNAWNGLKTTVINYANELWSNLGIKFDSGIQALIGILLAFSPVGIFIQVFAPVWAWFTELPAKFKQFGSNMLDGLKQGILGKASSVIDSVTSIASKIKNAFTSARAMDIHSPSRVFRGYGDNIMQGLNNGLLANNSPIQSMIATSNNLRNAMDTSAIRFDTRKPIMATMGMGGSMAQMGRQSAQPVTINIYTQPNQNEQQIAQLVAQELGKQQSNNNALYDMAEDW